MLEDLRKTQQYSNNLQFQGGAFDPWGGNGFLACSELLNYQFERVFFKNNFSFRVAFMNLYMVNSPRPWYFKTILMGYRSSVALTGATWVTLVATHLTTMDLPSRSPATLLARSIVN